MFSELIGLPKQRAAIPFLTASTTGPIAVRQVSILFIRIAATRLRVRSNARHHERNGIARSRSLTMIRLSAIRNLSRRPDWTTS